MVNNWLFGNSFAELRMTLVYVGLTISYDTGTTLFCDCFSFFDSLSLSLASFLLLLHF